MSHSEGLKACVFVWYTADYGGGGGCIFVLCDQPLLLRPTACWRLDWEELECNQQRFHALTQLLGDQVSAHFLAFFVKLLSRVVTRALCF